ncbi:transient receptor potential cation channel subfamily M member 6-like isoform X3 [Gouania willdenowi]|uniref:transient receptor potential cation channel subfamily M member 6-like isoform X3 n=1 Tax=Gouania willdenowi TaxID=441366 RepID=UPI001055B9FF|nr:transient receptor potential cation channel subfamily M member 6-like isoform X3 [Gouania willdenowi]
MPRKCWIEETFSKRECVKFIPSSWNLHRCVPLCQVCQSLIRCCCGRLMGEHLWHDSNPPISLQPVAELDEEETWSVELHTSVSPTDAYGTVDFQDAAMRVCRAKYVRVAVDSKPEVLLQLMLREWQMERPKLLLSIHGGSENFSLSPKVKQTFSKGLITAALSTGAWILSDGINTGVSKYVGEAVKTFGSHDLRKRNTVGITPWGVIDNNTDLIGRDAFRPYYPVGNPFSKRSCLSGFHSHFLLVDDGTQGKHGCQHGLRQKLEKQIQLQKIHPRLNQGVPVVCVVVEGGPAIVSTVLDYVSRAPPVPVFVFEGSGRAADLLAFLHKHTSVDRQLETDIEEDFLARIGDVFALDMAEATNLYALLLQCMEHRRSITIFDSESEDQVTPDAAILTATLKGTKASPAEQLSMALAWDRADIALKDVLWNGQHWQMGSLEQAMLDALVMDRVNFVKMLIDNGMTISCFLTVERLEDLYNSVQGQTQCFLLHLVEDAKKTSLPQGYRLSIIDIGLVIEYLIGGAYRSTYTRKHFRAAYSYMQDQEGRKDCAASTSKHKQGLGMNIKKNRSVQDLKFSGTSHPYKRRDQQESSSSSQDVALSPGLTDLSCLVPFNFNDLFVWAVLQQRQQMALFLWQHAEEALARAIVACKLYRSMAFEARQSSMDDDMTERFKTYSLDFGQLAVDMLDCAFQQNEQMAMKLLTTEMEAWSHFTCLQMAVSASHRPFVSHSSTQTLLTDLWTGTLNMRKNSFLKIILSLLLPPAILLLEFKSKAEMCHVPQNHETMLFAFDSVKTARHTPGTDHTDAEKGFSINGKSLDPKVETVSSITVRCLSWITKLHDFYTAPVVKFWFHTISYLAFLILFSYVVLVKMEDYPNVQEWLVIVYILSTAVEKTREVLMSEPRKLSQKLKVWFAEYWNLSDFIAILLFLAGLTLRWCSDPYRTAGRIAYSLDIIFWFVRVVDLLAVNQYSGPYVTMIMKMTSNMFFIVVMMAIVLLSFGVSRKAILSPDEDPSWSLARDIVFQPYWMIYGEVYATEINPCDDGQPCPPASFLAPFLQAVYMFFQYIIMVNILIAFFNNVYFEMESISSKLWKYNRYRYIMTYQDRPWLPPPLIILSHVALGVKGIYRKFRGDPETEERGSGLKLYLGHQDRKKLHEFEEKCVQVYYYEKSECLHSNQMNRIKTIAERAEEMYTTVEEVSEKVHLIQDSLSKLDYQFGQLQDLSAQAVDTLTMLSASDSLHLEEAHLAQCRLNAASKHVHPHSWSLQHGSGADFDVVNMPRLMAKSCRSTPPSLLKACIQAACRQGSQKWHGEEKESKGGKCGHPEEEKERTKEDSKAADAADHFIENPTGISRPGSFASLSQLFCTGPPFSVLNQTPSEACEIARCEPPSFPEVFESFSQEKTSRDKDKEDKREWQTTQEKPSNVKCNKSSSCALLLLDSEDMQEGLINPSFTLGESQTSSRDTCTSHCRRLQKPVGTFIDRPYISCRSLSSSMENVNLSGAPLSPKRGSFPSLNEPMIKNSLWCRRGFGDATSLQQSRGREWSQSFDFSKSQNRKMMKIHEGGPDDVSVQSALANASWRRDQRLRGGHTCWSASTSLSQLNFEPVDLLQKKMFSHQDVWSPTHSAWNSWARPMNQRSLLQSFVAPEAKSSSFQSTENLYPHYSAVERNNLMRLAHTIPFTPVNILGGEEVSVYTLEAGFSEAGPETGWMPTWSSRGLIALLQPISSKEGNLDGGLRQCRRMLCTWAEQEVLKPGQIYVVKAFRPEVVHDWQRLFHGNTALQLCLREIQQQRAAQKMMQVFNQVKPDDMQHSPRFLNLSLIHVKSNGQWLTIESNMNGDFKKYNNKAGEEITPCCSLEERLLAFSHWTFEYSCRELIVLDIQGVGEELTHPTVVMADNQSGSRGEMLFGPDNGTDAINAFLEKHSCNVCCCRLGLKDLRKRPDSCEGSRQIEKALEKENQETT